MCGRERCGRGCRAGDAAGHTAGVEGGKKREQLALHGHPLPHPCPHQRRSNNTFYVTLVDGDDLQDGALLDGLNSNLIDMY